MSTKQRHPTLLLYIYIYLDVVYIYMQSNNIQLHFGCRKVNIVLALNKKLKYDIQRHPIMFWML